MTAVNEPFVPHPLADSEGEGTVRTETRAPVVHLSEGRLDLLAKVARAGGRVVLVSDGRSVLTEPMRHALQQVGGRWVVRGSDGQLRDGRSGRRLDRFQDAVTAGPPRSPDDVSLAHLDLRTPTATQLVVSASTRHQARAETLLGGTVERLVRHLGGDVPSGWGTHEPTARTWDRPAMTAHARSRMPRATTYVVTGSPRLPLALDVTARRTDRGVEELVTGLVGIGGIDDDDVTRRLADVPRLLAGMAEVGMPLFGLVMARRGRADLAWPPVLESPPVPVALLIGPPGVRSLGLDVADLGRRFDAAVTGRPRTPGLVVPLGDGVDPAGISRLAEVLDAVGGPDVLRAAGADPVQEEQVRRAAEQ